MSDTETERGRVEAAVGALAGWAGRSLAIDAATVVMASPSWRGVDGTPWRVRDERTGESLIVKTMHEDSALYIDTACAFSAAQQAARAGLGPRVVRADLGDGVLVMEDLDDGWRTGTLELLSDPEIRDGVIAARRAVHKGAALARNATVFQEIEWFLGDALAAEAYLPADLDWLVENVRTAGDAIEASGVDLVPAHGDGNVSNMLVGPDKQIRLVDWDRAANMDAFEDFGSFLAEAYPFDAEAQEAFEVFHGHLDERLFDRARLYGLADDLRWGLIGAMLAAKSPRTKVEFLKFADWRFLRCRMGLRDPRFVERLRRV